MEGAQRQAGLIGRPWRRRDYAGNAGSVAERLLGRVLVRVLDDGAILAGRIVETEAYMGVVDRASHAFGGRRTARNEVMYAGPGIAYVYFTYGMHYCFNVVCGRVGEPAAVLIRALEPVLGGELMRRFRRRSGRAPSRLSDTDLCSGPGKLCQAFRIDRGLNGADMTVDGRLRVCEAAGGRDVRQIVVVRTPRVGLANAGEWADRPLRFVAQGNPHISV